ncbi:MAG: hypothetical protein M0Z94_13580 [Dehalococcoidales bacterium]|nr:hypothetical protein [Dehalococcoidales bacterium]
MAGRWWVTLGIAALVVGLGLWGGSLAGSARASVELAPRLTALVGRTGLDPFDPVSPLAKTEVLDVRRPANGPEEVLIRFAYEDGRSREYWVWASNRQRLFRLGPWQYTGLDRLLAPYEELPTLPLVPASAPVRIGEPTLLTSVEALTGEAHAFDYPSWYTPSVPSHPCVWSPRGDAVLVTIPGNNEVREQKDLWLVPLDGGKPILIAEDAEQPSWSPDGRQIIYWTPTADGPLYVVADRQGSVVRGLSGPRTVSRYAPGDDGLYLVYSGALRFLSYAAQPGDPPQPLRGLPGVDGPGAQGDFTISPDGRTIAYACGRSVCLADLAGSKPVQVALPDLAAPIAAHPTPTPANLPPPAPTMAPAGKAGWDPDEAYWPRLRLAWSPDGRLLAVSRFRADLYRPAVAIVTASGDLVADYPAGPNGELGIPQWTPDGAYLFLPALPEHGRRLVVMEAATGRLYDLTQPNWDAEFYLSPTGDRIILTNGRGSFYVAEVVR